MKELIFSFIFLKLINLSISLIPIWDIKKSSIELTKLSSITLHTKDSWPKISLIKKFEENETSLFDQNYISVEDKESQKTNWEDIESSYYLEEWGYLICPKGKNYLNVFNKEENTYEQIIPTDFDSKIKIGDNDQWELLCYRIGEKYFMFQGFLEQEKINYMYGYKYKYSDENNNIWKNISMSGISFLDFMLSYQANYEDSTNKEYNMSTIYLKNSKIYANLIKITIDYKDDLYLNSPIETECYLDEKLDYTYGYFNHTTKKFYWISASKTNYYRSGHSIEGITKDNIKIIKNNTSPLKFLQNVTINKIEIIRNTRFAYYEVISKDDNDKYFGIIDLEINQVIFNTNEKLIIFKPIKNISMLAITKDKRIFQICLNKWNKECVESCPDGQILFLDSEKGNHCEEKSTHQNCNEFLLIPEQICVSTCNTSININISSEENGVQKCGLCKDFYDDKPFKIFNEIGCIEEKPNGTFYLSEEFKILKRCNDNCEECESSEKCNICKKGFKNNGTGQCEPIHCHSNCETCEEDSFSEENQKCISCKNDLLLQEKNCVEKCSVGYYKQENNQTKSCLRCSKNCKKCSKGIADENENCEECESKFYLIDEPRFPKNCVETCPEGFNISHNFCKIINETEPQKNESDGDNSNYMLWIFIILCVIILLLVSICICKKYYSKNKNDVEFINDINTELQENNQIVE